MLCSRKFGVGKYIHAPDRRLKVQIKEIKQVSVSEFKVI
jgi:hypothetical protein